MANNKLFIHASNIHQGGGKSLLEALVFSGFTLTEVIVIADERMSFTDAMPINFKLVRVAPTTIDRLKAEWWLKRNVRNGDTVLCFGNLPPLFKLNAHTVVFVQNRYLADNLSTKGFSSKTRLRLMLERYWLRINVSHCNLFIIQTRSMKNCLTRNLPGSVQILVLPFAQHAVNCVRALKSSKTASSTVIDGEFIYVASGEPHKNHRRLIEAWALLAKEEIFPNLYLTLDVSGNLDLWRWIEQEIHMHNLHVKNLGVLTKDELQASYSQVSAMIYPSLFESLGLPLIEARQSGLAILAAELDYVRDILDPEQSFDPHSAISIARAVKRFMGKEEPSDNIISASNFLTHVWKRTRPRCVS